jgi:hypothetical protein
LAARAQAEAGSSSGSNGVSGLHLQQQAAVLEQQQRQTHTQHEEDQPGVWTKFVAETLLPTKLGKFRLRGYRHTVRPDTCSCTCTDTPAAAATAYPGNALQLNS